MPRPPDERAGTTPWPTYPLMYRVSSAHEEGGQRVFSVNTEEFVGKDGHVRALKVHEVMMQDGKFVKVEDSDFELEADLVLLAMGFVGPEKPGLLTDLGVTLTDRGNVARNDDFDTSVAGRVRCRRHGSRPVVDRLGDCRGQGRSGGCGPVFDGFKRAASTHQADGRATPVITLATPETFDNCSARRQWFARRLVSNNSLWA